MTSLPDVHVIAPVQIQVLILIVLGQWIIWNSASSFLISPRNYEYAWSWEEQIELSANASSFAFSVFVCGLCVMAFLDASTIPTVCWIFQVGIFLFYAFDFLYRFSRFAPLVQLEPSSESKGIQEWVFHHVMVMIGVVFLFVYSSPSASVAQIESTQRCTLDFALMEESTVFWSMRNILAAKRKKAIQPSDSLLFWLKQVTRAFWIAIVLRIVPFACALYEFYASPLPSAFCIPWLSCFFFMHLSWCRTRRQNIHN